MYQLNLHRWNGIKISQDPLNCYWYCWWFWSFYYDYYRHHHQRQYSSSALLFVESCFRTRFAFTKLSSSTETTTERRIINQFNANVNLLFFFVSRKMFFRFQKDFHTLPLSLFCACFVSYDGCGIWHCFREKWMKSAEKKASRKRLHISFTSSDSKSWMGFGCMGQKSCKAFSSRFRCRHGIVYRKFISSSSHIECDVCLMSYVGMHYAHLPNIHLLRILYRSHNFMIYS